MPFRSPSVLRAVYTGWAPIYDVLVPVLSSRAHATALQRLSVSDGEHVLDVGTGTGRALRPLAANNPSGYTVGVEPTPAMRTRARRRDSLSVASVFA